MMAHEDINKRHENKFIYAVDKKYLPHFFTSLESLVCCSECAIHVAILHFNLEPHLIKLIEQHFSNRNVCFYFRQIDASWVRGMAPAGNLSMASLLRIFSDRVLDWNSGLYVDCDTIFLRRPKLPLNSFPSKILAKAVSDPYIGSHFTEKIGLSKGQPYFNSGVMHMNLKQWRLERVSFELAKILRTKIGVLTYQDQDALNLVCAGRWEKLSPKYNIQSGILFSNSYSDLFGYSKKEIEKSRSNANIIHFTGDEVPWVSGCQNPYTDIYWTYRNKTPFRSWFYSDLGARSLYRNIRKIWS